MGVEERRRLRGENAVEGDAALFASVSRLSLSLVYTRTLHTYK